MFHRKTALVFGLIITLLFFTACSSGSPSNPNNPNPSNPSSPSNPQPSNSNITVLPRNTEQPNTVSPSLARDSSGTMHAAYTDIDGRGFYAQCKTQCDTQSNWLNTEVLNLEINALTGSISAKLQLDRNDKPHLAFAVNYGNSGIFSKQELYYANCTSDCLSTPSWSLGLTYTHSRAHLASDTSC